MAANLTSQVRTVVDVVTAVAEGDLTRKVEIEARGEVAALADTINAMVERLSTFSSEVTRVVRDVGTKGKLGVEAEGFGSTSPAPTCTCSGPTAPTVRGGKMSCSASAGRPGAE
jgi:methyl-accepting chemotaxis protein